MGEAEIPQPETKDTLTTARESLAKAHDTLWGKLPETKNQEEYAAMLSEYRQELLKGAVDVAKHFGVVPSNMAAENLKSNLADFSFTDPDPNHNDKYHPHEIAIINPYGATPFALRIEHPNDDGSLDISVAFMRQGNETGAKLFMPGKIDNTGNITFNGAGVLETYNQGREQENYFWKLENGTATPISGNRFEYSEPSKTFGPIPRRERMRVFHDAEVELATGPENDPASRSQAMSNHEFETIGPLKVDGMIEFFTKKNAQPPKQDFASVDVFAYSKKP